MRRLGRLLRCLSHGFSDAERVLGGIRQFPERDLAGVLLDSPALIVAPHPDDESLGCGGLIAQASSIGAMVHVLVVTDGSASHPGSIAPTTLRDLRRKETTAAVKLLGVAPNRLHFWDVPDGLAPQNGRPAAALGQRMAALVRQIGAKTVFATWEMDSHPDHVAAYNYAAQAARAQRVALFAYPVWAWMLPPHTALPNRRLQGFSLPIAAQRAMKRAAVLQHASQTAQQHGQAPIGFDLSKQQLDAMITSTEYFIASNAPALERLNPVGKAVETAAIKRNPAFRPGPQIGAALPVQRSIGPRNKWTHNRHARPDAR